MPPASPSTAPRESARPATGSSGFDTTYDIVVVGGGGAGLPTALFARWLGNRVLVLEKAPRLGGTNPRTTACATWPGWPGRSATTPTRPASG
jgi:glycine/D-amino acid oxidase-like deaminating enzyme